MKEEKQNIKIKFEDCYGDRKSKFSRMRIQTLDKKQNDKIIIMLCKKFIEKNSVIIKLQGSYLNLLKIRNIYKKYSYIFPKSSDKRIKRGIRYLLSRIGFCYKEKIFVENMDFLMEKNMFIIVKKWI